MEEGFVLDFANTRMVQILHVHEVSWLCPFIIGISAIRCIGARSIHVGAPIGIFLVRAKSRGTRRVLLHRRDSLTGATKATRRLRPRVNLVRRVIDCVLASELVKLTFHKEVEEVASGAIITHLAIQVHCPKQRMRVGSSRIRERDKIDCNVANNTFFIQYSSN